MSRGSKMSTQTTFMVIMIAIIFSFIIMRVKGENYPNEAYVCEKVITASDESGKYLSLARVRMLKKCDKSYVNNDTIKQKCEEWPTYEDQLRNQFIIFPVRSNKMDIIYWNMYCAWCNFDDDLRFNAIPLLHFATINKCGLSKFHNFQYGYTESVFSMYANALCYGNTPRYIWKEYLIDDDYCNEILNSSEQHDPIYQISGNYCNIDLSMACPELPFRNDLLCTYGEVSYRSNYCKANLFLFEGINFAYGEDGTIYNPILTTFKHYPDEYSSQTGTDGVIYLCGEETPNPLNIYLYDKKTPTNTKPLNTAVISLYSVSMIYFLILCLILNTSTKSLKNPFNRTLYSFCITQLIYLFLYLNYKFLLTDRFCIATYIMDKFVTFSRILWNTVVIFEYSRLIYSLIRNQGIPAKIQTKKYIVYCLVCWILPALATIPLLYILMFNEKSSSCPNIEEYSLVSCTYDSNSNLHQYTTLLSRITEKIAIICCAIITLGSFTSILAIAYIQWQKTIGSNCKRNYLLIYVKMMVAMSAHLAFGLFYSSSPTDDQVLLVILLILDGCLGVFIFSTFYYKKTMLSKFKKPLAPENVEMNEQERPISLE